MAILKVQAVNDYGSTQDADIVVPLTLVTDNHPSRSKNTKKLMWACIIGMTVAAVVSSALLFVSRMDSSVRASTDESFLLRRADEKNLPASHWKEIPVEVIVPQAMKVQELEGRVTEVVRNILSDNERRDLASMPLFSVYTGEATETECASIYSAAVDCYDAIIMIVSEGNHADVVISKLKDLLEKVVDQQGIVVSSNKKGYPYVQLKNDTPYPIAHSYESPYQTDDDNAAVIYGQTFCHDDRILEGIAPGDTWTATSRGLCTVRNIYAYLTLPDDSQLDCTQYYSAGTTYSEFSVIMGGVDGCCVKSSHQDQVCK